MKSVLNQLVLCCGLFLCAILVVSKSRAGGEASGGSVFKTFRSMSSQEVLNSKLWFVRPRKIYVPAVSQEVSPKNLCLQNQQIVVTEAVDHCETWVTQLRKLEAGKDYRLFRYKEQARSFAYTRNGARQFYCGQKVTDSSQMPVRESIEDCVSWAVKLFDEPWPKLFKTYKEAERFQRENKNSWSPTCEEWGKRIQQVPTTFKVDFYKDSQSLGTHEYPIQNCGSL